jgi:hypothetical protein
LALGVVPTLDAGSFYVAMVRFAKALAAVLAFRAGIAFQNA